jgi:UDP:flavonoid glycosyltransferase YjiC (YdhE family)
MKILVAALGSHGDVLPMIGLCKALQARGQEVTLYTAAYFAGPAAEAGVPMRAIGASASYLALLREPDLVHPTRGHRVISKAIAEYLPELYHALDADIEPGRTVLIGTLLAFPVRLLHELRAVPCVIVHLSPATLRSSFGPTRFTAHDLSPRLPPVLRDLLWRGIDRWMLDPLYGAPLNRFRRSLGLGPVRSVLDRWMNGADLVVALFPTWFAAPQPDWPARLRQTGFPLYDATRPLPQEVEHFLGRGPAPVGFTAGTATATSHAFFAAAIAACARSGRRGVLITHVPEQIPRPLPAGVAHFSYVPFSALLPRLAAFVHHGGIGTTSQALRAGVPQLIRPMAYDQLDNARRVETLGVAVEILPRHFDGRTAARALEELIADRWVGERCQNWARVLAAADGCETTANLIIDSFPLAQSRRSVAT